MRLFGCNLICLNEVKENEQSWGKHINSVCPLVKNDLNCPFLTLYLTSNDEIQITQQYTRGLVIEHRIESSSPYFGVYNYGTVCVNFNNRQGHRISNSESVYEFDLYIKKNVRKSKNQKIDYCKKCLDTSVADKKNDIPLQNYHQLPCHYAYWFVY